MPAEITQETINGLAVDRIGDDGPRILFVHGSSGGSWYWHSFMGYFAEHGYRCHAVNLRGHGANPVLPELGKVSLRDYVEDVQGVIEALGPVILVGHSMGGAVAQVVAQHAPLHAAVFAAPAPVAGVKFRNPPMNFRMALHSLRVIPAMVRKKAIKPSYRAAAASLFNRFEPEQQKELWQQLQPESATVAMEVLKGSIEADLSHVRFPMLTAVGTEDRTTTPEMVRDIARYHGTAFEEFTGHGHMFMIEPGWQRCADRLITWLRQAVPEPAQ